MSGEADTGAAIPTLHLVRAALRVASMLDPRGSRIADAHESYWRHATGGVFPPADLERGERLLVRCGLVMERGGTLYPTDELIEVLDGIVDDGVALLAVRVLAETLPTAAGPDPANDEAIAALVPDPARREELLIALGRRWDDTLRRQIGAAGEEVVVAAARLELQDLGHPELARRVRRVSLESDQLGYDVSAPRTTGGPRLLEVKATTEVVDAVVVHVSRNEIETGRRYPSDWALVVCEVSDVSARRGTVLGWCGVDRLDLALPEDTATGRWEVVAMHLSVEALEPGLPRSAR